MSDACPNEFDVVKLLEVAYSHQSTTKGHPAIRQAICEIERLRAGQFRWIAVSEERPNPAKADKWGDILVVRQEGGAVERRNWENSHCISHWAPIPPLPERTQEEKDEALWRDNLKPTMYVDDYARGMAKLGFLAGLKAARGEK